MGRKCMSTPCGRPVVQGSSYCDIHNKNSSGASPKAPAKKTTSGKKPGDPGRAAGK